MPNSAGSNIRASTIPIANDAATPMLRPATSTAAGRSVLSMRARPFHVDATATSRGRPEILSLAAQDRGGKTPLAVDRGTLPQQQALDGQLGMTGISVPARRVRELVARPFHLVDDRGSELTAGIREMRDRPAQMLLQLALRRRELLGRDAGRLHRQRDMTGGMRANGHPGLAHFRQLGPGKRLRDV